MPAVTPDIEQNHIRVDILTTADVKHLCSEHGIQSDVVCGAHKQHRGDSRNVDWESIFTMALAHRKMALILVKLGLQKCIYESYTHAKGKSQDQWETGFYQLNVECFFLETRLVQEQVNMV